MKELIGITVRRIRKRLGLTQKQLAQQASIKQSYLSRIETGQRALSLDVLERIAGALEVPPSDILKVADITSENVVDLVPEDIASFLKAQDAAISVDSPKGMEKAGIGLDDLMKIFRVLRVSQRVEKEGAEHVSEQSVAPQAQKADRTSVSTKKAKWGRRTPDYVRNVDPLDMCSLLLFHLNDVLNEMKKKGQRSLRYLSPVSRTVVLTDDDVSELMTESLVCLFKAGPRYPFHGKGIETIPIDFGELPRGIAVTSEIFHETIEKSLDSQCPNPAGDAKLMREVLCERIEKTKGVLDIIRNLQGEKQYKARYAQCVEQWRGDRATMNAARINHLARVRGKQVVVAVENMDVHPLPVQESLIELVRDCMKDCDCLVVVGVSKNSLAKLWPHLQCGMKEPVLLHINKRRSTGQHQYPGIGANKTA